MHKILPIITLIASLNAHAVLGPIPIYLNTEYRTDAPVIGTIASTLSFDADDIKAKGANTFLDFLATVPSVGLFSQTGNIPAIFMRGGHSNHTLVLVDGVSVNSASSLNGAVEYGLSTIALNDIEKVEIIKNSGSVLYGSSAVSGVINVITKKGSEIESIDITTKIGTHNSKAYDLSANAGDGQGNFIQLSHNKYTTDGINARTDDTTGEKDGIDTQATSIKFGNPYFDFSVSQSANKTDFDADLDFDGTIDADALVGDNRSNKISFNAYRTFNDNWKTSVSMTRIDSRRDEINSGVTTTGDQYKRTDFTLLNNLKMDDALLTVGLSATSDKNLNANLEHKSHDLFIDWQKNIDDLDLNSGLRYINHNTFDKHIIYNSGVAKYFDNGFKLSTNYNTAFRAPTLKEVTSGTQTNDLKPETSTNLNLGLEHSFAWGEAGLALFKSQTKDRITYVDSWPNSVYENSTVYDTQGVELSINAFMANYRVDFDHTYANSSDNNSEAEPVRRPRNISNLTVNKRHGNFNSRAQVMAKSASKDSGDIPGYALLNLSSDYAISPTTKVTSALKNATDKDYITADTWDGYHYNALGRTVEVGITHQF